VAKRVAVLGATGSIGGNALEVIRGARGDFLPVLLSAHEDENALFALAREFPGAMLALSAERAGARGKLDALEGRKIFYGKAGLLEAVRECGAEAAVNGIAGAAGLEPSLAALESGADLALANKETVVMAWRVVSALAARRGARILPVDSEHSAVFSLLEAHVWPLEERARAEEERARAGGECARAGEERERAGGERLRAGEECALDGEERVRPLEERLRAEERGGKKEIILTASGGPFRDLSAEELRAATAEGALAHPTWKMGRKISIDSASLANKGLEVIEAVRLFDTPAEQVKVAVHRQSLVHAMIRLADGALYAELSPPDMRLPIQKALYHPRRVPNAFARLPMPPATPLSLSFEEPDGARFPMLPLAYAAVRSGELYTVAYNAANEEAVGLFLENKIGFMDIPRITEETLALDWTGEADALETILDADARARSAALRAAF
jgi:1-deoxy-D-xylulose-5-phosphate reductoisomerase